MKAIKFLSILIFAICLSFAIASCGSGHDHSHESHGHDQAVGHSHDGHGEGAAYTSAYVCPMHCEGSGSEQEGKCPVCGMDYVSQEAHTKDGHSH